MGNPSTANKRAMKAGEAANKLIRQVAGDTDDDSALQDPEKAQLKEVPKDDAEASADPEKNLDQPKPSELGAEPKKTGTDWEARFKGLQLAYDRDVPKMRGDLESAYTLIETLKGEIDDVKELINKPPELTVEEQIETEFTAEEIEQYGPGQIGMMKRIAEGSKTQIAKDMLALQETIAELKSGQRKIVDTVVVSREDKFFADLKKAVPNWDVVNNDAAFHAFLDEEVPYTGKKRLEFLEAAREGLQTSNVIQIFTDVLGVAPNSSSHSNEPELKPEGFSTPEDLVEPMNSGGGPTPLAEEKYYTNAEVTTFYNDKAKGKYRGKEEEAKIIENDIFAAGQTGRILSDRQADKAYRFTDKELGKA